MRATSFLATWVLVGVSALACSSAPPPANVGPEATAAAAPAPVPEAPAPAATPSTEPVASAAAAPAPEPAGPPPPIPEGTTVLQVGDSMADALGKDLRKELMKRGVKAPFKWQEATYIPEWAGFKHGFDGLIARHDPDLVIITLGGNESAMADPTVRIPPIKKLVEKVGDRPCLWVAYPLWPDAPDNGLLEVIRDNCAPCQFVDTNALIKPKMEVLNDGVHPTLAERKRWANYMYRFLRHNRDPEGERPWDFRTPLEAPPPSSVDWD